VCEADEGGRRFAKRLMPGVWYQSMGLVLIVKMKKKKKMSFKKKKDREEGGALRNVKET